MNKGATIVDRQTTIGVIIPSYNGEKYLEECVMSVINQQCKDFIIVIIDDGSTDSTLSISNKLSNKYDCIYVLHQENQGVSVARNNGIEFCLKKGIRYVAFLDSDDVWCSNFYDNALRDEIVRNDKDAYQFNHYFGEQGLIRGKFCNTSFGKDRFAPPDHFCSMFYKTVILRNDLVRFPAGCKYCEDHAFKHLFFVFCKSYQHFDRANFIYRNNKSSVTNWQHINAGNYFSNILMAWSYVYDVAIKLNAEKLANMAMTSEKMYVVEYIEVACRSGERINKIKQYLKKCEFASLYDNDDVWVDDITKRKWNEFSEHPIKFWIKAQPKGILIKVRQKFKYLAFVQRMIYPTNLVDCGVCAGNK